MITKVMKRGLDIKMSKKAQEEAVGFVIIVVIVLVIGLIFFTFALQKGKTIEVEKAEVYDFLQVMSSYTTDCSINSMNLNVRELIKECHNNPTKNCEDQTNACTKLETTAKNILQELIGKGTEIANERIHGYALNITNARELVYIEEGSLNGNYFVSSLPGVGEDITIKLKCYYS